ncbi:MAG: STAS domain-containing protein [Fibrobacterota bacterium]
MAGNELLLEFPSSLSLADMNLLVKHAIELLTTHPAGNVVLDLTRTPLISSLAIGSIIRLHNLYSQNGRRVILRNVSPENHDILATTGLINVLSLETGSSVPVRAAFSVRLDFEFHGEIGVFKFSGSLAGVDDSELCLKTVEKIVNDDHRMLLDISRLVPIDRLTDSVYHRLVASIIKSKGKIRIFCSDPVSFGAYLKRMNGSAITLFASRAEALVAWEMGV